MLGHCAKVQDSPAQATTTAASKQYRNLSLTITISTYYQYSKNINISLQIYKKQSNFANNREDMDKNKYFCKNKTQRRERAASLSLASCYVQFARGKSGQHRATILPNRKGSAAQAAGYSKCHRKQTAMQWQGCNREVRAHDSGQ